MEKFINRFFPTMQFVLLAIVAVLVTIMFVSYIFTGKLNILSFILCAGVGGIVFPLTIKAYKEMKEVYQEEV